MDEFSVLCTSHTNCSASVSFASKRYLQSSELKNATFVIESF